MSQRNAAVWAARLICADEVPSMAALHRVPKRLLRAFVAEAREDLRT